MILFSSPAVLPSKSAVRNQSISVGTNEELVNSGDSLDSSVELQAVSERLVEALEFSQSSDGATAAPYDCAMAYPGCFGDPQAVATLGTLWSLT